MEIGVLEIGVSEIGVLGIYSRNPWIRIPFDEYFYWNLHNVWILFPWSADILSASTNKSKSCGQDGAVEKVALM